jgi:predicted PurR-regulated permease PerM
MTDTRAGQRYDAFRIAMMVVGAAVLLLLLWQTRILVLTVFLGILFALAVSAGADRLAQWRVPRGIAAPLIVFAFVGLVAGFGSWIGPTVRKQTVELRTKLPEALGKLEQWVGSRGGGVIATITGLGDTTAPAQPDSIVNPADSSTRTGIAADSTSSTGTGAAAGAVTDSTKGAVVVPATKKSTATPLRDRLLAQIGGFGRQFLHVLGSTLAVLAGIVLVIFLSIYFAIDPSVYRRGLLHLVPPGSREQTEEVLTAIAVTLRKWLVTQLIAMVVIGTVTTIVLMALKVRAAVPLGILAGLLEFVPTLGPVLSAVPAIAMGFVDSPQKALAVGIAYIGIQFVENHLLIPILMKQGLNLPPALTIIMQSLMALVFGVMGLLVAVPMLAAIMIAAQILTSHQDPQRAMPATKA